MSLRRMFADILDFFICFFLAEFIFIKLELFDDLNMYSSSVFELIMFYVVPYLFFFILFALKDCIFRNASIGKKLFGIKIVYTDKENNEKISFITHCKRSIPLIILPIEAFLLVIWGDKRLGDIWAKTKIIRNKTKSNTKFKSNV